MARKWIAPAIEGFELGDQEALDRRPVEFDGTDDKGRPGANAVLGGSLAYARASAEDASLPLYRWIEELAGTTPDTLPLPMFNIPDGGRHAADSTDFQEFMVTPVGMTTFAEALRAGAEVFAVLRAELHDQGLATGQGDEGGFAPRLPSNEAAIELVTKCIEWAGYRPGEDVAIALDPAVSELVEDRSETDAEVVYHLGPEGRDLTSSELIDFWESWIGRFPIVSLEDGSAEHDWSGWQRMTARLGDRVQLVGDDIFVTNPQRLARGLAEQSANAILISSTRSARSPRRWRSPGSLVSTAGATS